MPTTDKISPYQSYALFLMTILGTGILSLPRRMAIHVGNDGIWVIFIAGALTWFIVYIMTKLSQRFPDQTLVEYSEEICTIKKVRWIGKMCKYVILILFAFSWLVLLADVVRTFGEAIVSSILQRTPLEVILIVFLLFAVMIAGGKIELIAKFNELLLPLLIIPVVFFIIAIIQKGELINLLPLFDLKWPKLGTALLDTVFDFAGYNTILIFLAFYQKPNDAVKKHSIGLLIVVLYYWLAILTTNALFSSEVVRGFLWPTAEIVRPVNLPIQIFERLESGMLIVWMTASFTTVTNILAAFVEVCMRTFALKEKNRKWTAILLILPTFVISMIPDNVYQLNWFFMSIGRYVLLIDVVIPLTLLIIAWIRKKKGAVVHEKTLSS